MKLLKTLLFAVFYVILSFYVQAQSPTDYWYFSNQKGLNFNGYNPPTVLTNGQTSGSNWWEMEPYSTISDDNGNLLFYTDGLTIWDRDHNVMTNGTGIKAYPSSTQGALIVPKPGSSSIYYLFTSNTFTGNIDGLYYSVVDMSLPGNGNTTNPKGEVTSTKNVLLLDNNSEKMTALATESGDSIWILTHAYGTASDPNTSATTDVYGDNFYAWLLTQNGVEGIETSNSSIPVISTIGTRLQVCSGVANVYGQMKFSPRGDKIANVSPPDACEAFELFDFDITTGQLSNMISISLNISSSPSPYGLSFSPDGSKLYVSTRPDNMSNSNSQLIQYDLLDTNYKCGFQYASGSQINASKVVLANAPSPGAYQQLQLGIDGRLYVSRYNSNYMAVVNWPNQGGTAAGLDNTAINLGSTSYGIGLPNFIESYFHDTARLEILSPDTSVCQGDSATIRAFANMPVKWEPSTGLSCTDCLNPKAAPATTTKYYMTDSVQNCFLDSVEVEIISSAALTVTPDTHICRGDTLQLAASGANNFAWSPTGSLSDSDVVNPLAFPDTTTIYTVRSEAGNCSDTQTVTVTVDSVPTVSVTPDTALCSGDSVQLSATGGNLHAWAPATGLSDTTISNPYAKPTATTQYIVIASNVTACRDTGYVEITVIPAPVIMLESDTFLCQGDSIQLTAVLSNADSFFWSPSLGLSDSAVLDPFAKPGSTNTYTLFASNQNLCEAKDSIRIEVVNSVNLVISNDTDICRGSSVSLIASGANTYSWAPSKYLDDTASPNPVATPDTTIRYVVTGAIGNCIAQDSVLITVLPAPDLVLASDTSSCRGASVQLSATGADSVVWMSGTYLDDSNSFTPVSTPDTSITYLVTGWVGSCTDTDSVAITVNVLPELTVSNDTTICSGATVLLFASGATSYEWTPGTYLDDNLVAAPVSNPDDTIQYVIRGANGSCIDVDTVNIYVIPSPEITVSNDTLICEGRSVNLFASGADSFLWDPSNYLSDPSIANPIAFPAATTLYKVYGSNALGCADTDSVRIAVVPKPQINFVPEISGCLNETVTIEVTGASTYMWNTGTTFERMFVVADSTREYFVIGYNEQGCPSDTAFIRVIADSTSSDCADLTSYIIVPTAFSPNGNGLNDVFIYVYENIGSFEIIIYNRWGEELFRSNNINHFWDATYKGNPVQDGAYLFIIDAVGLDEVKYSLKGTVTILR